MPKTKSKPFLTLEDALKAGDAAEALILRDPAQLDEVIAKLPGLRSLEISRFAETKAMQLPESIGELANLESLIAAGQGLSDLPASLAKLSQLKVLDVSDNHFVGLPDVIFELRWLKELSISGHIHRFLALGKPSAWGFARIDPRLFGLNSLTKLDLGANRIEEVSEEIASLSGLETLTLSNNPFKMLPEALGSLSKLKKLNLGGTAIAALPESMGKLSSLQALDVRNTKLVVVPPEVLALPKLDSKSRKVLESYAGAKPVFETGWLTSIPALVQLLGEDGTASLMHYINYQMRGCSHDPDEYDFWLRTPMAAGVSASPEQIYEAAKQHAPGGCACVLRDCVL